MFCVGKTPLQRNINITEQQNSFVCCWQVQMLFREGKIVPYGCELRTGLRGLLKVSINKTKQHYVYLDFC
jgi:hypothetical protein